MHKKLRSLVLIQAAVLIGGYVLVSPAAAVPWAFSLEVVKETSSTLQYKGVDSNNFAWSLMGHSLYTDSAYGWAASYAQAKSGRFSSSDSLSPNAAFEYLLTLQGPVGEEKQFSFNTTYKGLLYGRAEGSIQFSYIPYPPFVLPTPVQGHALAKVSGSINLGGTEILRFENNVDKLAWPLFPATEDKPLEGSTSTTLTLNSGDQLRITGRISSYAHTANEGTAYSYFGNTLGNYMGWGISPVSNVPDTSATLPIILFSLLGLAGFSRLTKRRTQKQKPTE